MRIRRSFILLLLVAVFIFCITSTLKFITFYKNVFRLSSSQISKSLESIHPTCEKIKECNLKDGDILIRRYITDRTRFIDKLAHPHFTHSAFYLGDNQITEAVGTEENSEDDIQTAVLSTSDWLNEDVVNFVVIRPKKYGSHLEIIKRNLEEIAKDRDYIFGFPKTGYKRTTCADLILDQLLNEGVVDVTIKDKITTPDYLFSIMQADPDDFEIIGYNID